MIVAILLLASGTPVPCPAFEARYDVYDARQPKTPPNGDIMDISTKWLLDCKDAEVARRAELIRSKARNDVGHARKVRSR